jgi:hypothetical protein
LGDSQPRGSGSRSQRHPSPRHPSSPDPKPPPNPDEEKQDENWVRMVGGPREERRPKEGGAPFLPPSDPGPAPDP